MGAKQSKVKENSEKMELPPAYNPFTVRTLKATDAPKFEWTNTQCREWIYASLVDLCGNSEQAALAKLVKCEFNGCGVNLWVSPIPLIDLAGDENRRKIR